MKHFSVFCAFFAFCVVLTSAFRIFDGEDEAKENLGKLALANNELAFNLHRRLVSGSSENVFFSPLSISTAFAMLFYGARGETAEELRKTLGYERANLPDDFVHDTFNHYFRKVLRREDHKDGYVLNAANAILVDERLGLLDEYRRNVQELYGASVRDVDFGSEGPKIVEEVNDYVREKTHGKIGKLFDKIDPSTLLVLANAVYFKGTWKTRFEQGKTRYETFYNKGLESEERRTPFMRISSEFPYAIVDNFQALELPYKGENVSMLILLPIKHKGLQDLEESLTPEKLEEVQHRLHTRQVDVTLPKFKLQFEKEFSPEMQALGANRIFGTGADFSGMTSKGNVAVNQVVHKAAIEVNEEGSEAAAVTGIEAVELMAPPQFRANHPFFFAIVEKGSKRNMILFMGRVNEF